MGGLYATIYGLLYVIWDTGWLLYVMAYSGLIHGMIMASLCSYYVK